MLRYKEGMGLCQICEEPFSDIVMLKDNLWGRVRREAELLYRVGVGMLCVRCMEGILGRKIKGKDLKYLGGKRLLCNKEYAEKYSIEY